MTSRTPSLYAAALLLSLSAKPALHAQTAPLFVDISGVEPGVAEATSMAADGDGVAYLSGFISEDAPGTTAGFVSRLDVDGTTAWTRDFPGVSAERTRVLSVHAVAGDSLRVLLSEEPLATALDPSPPVFYVAQVAKADGGAGRAYPIDIGGVDVRLGPGGTYADAPVPGSRDFIFAYAPFGTNDLTLARVDAQGQRTWTTTVEADGNNGGWTNATDLAVSGDSIYIAATKSSLAVVAAADGARGDDASSPFEAGATANRRNRLIAKDDAVLWIASNSSRLAVVEIAAAERRLLGDASSSQLLGGQYVDVRRLEDRVLVYTTPLFGNGNLVEVLLRGNNFGQRVLTGLDSLKAAFGSGRPRPRAVLTDDGRILVAGTRTTERDDEPATVLVLATRAEEGGPATVVFEREGPRPSTGCTGEAILATSEGGVVVIRETAGGVDFVRRLDGGGAPLSDLPVAVPEGFERQGAYRLADDGALLVLLTPTSRTSDNAQLQLLRQPADGSPAEVLTIVQSARVLTPELLRGERGELYVQYRKDRGGQRDYVRIARLAADLSVRSDVQLTLGAGYAAEFGAEVYPTGQGYLVTTVLRQSTTETSGRIQKLDFDGAPEWIYDSGESVLGGGAVISDVAVTPAGTFLFTGSTRVPDSRSRRYRLDGLELDAVGREVATYSYDLSNDTPYDVQADGVRGAFLLQLAPLPLSLRYGLGGVDMRRISLDGTEQEIVEPQAPREFVPRGSVIYGNPTFVPGYVVVPGGAQAAVLAYGDVLSPVRQAAQSAIIAARAFPNPAPANATVNIETDAEVATWTIVDAGGRRVGRVLAKAGQVVLPSLPTGAYHLIGADERGRRYAVKLLRE